MELKHYFQLLMTVLAWVVGTSSAGAIDLSTAVQKALNTNPGVIEQSDEFFARQQEVEQAKAGYKPSVDLTAGIGPEWSDNRSTRALGVDGRTLTRKEAGLMLDQMLFDGYATSSEVDRQNARVDSQKYRLQGTSENIALDAVEVYANILRHKSLLAFSATNLKTHDRIFDQVELRFRSGVGSTADLDQVTGRRAGVAASLLSDEVNLRDAETNYINVVGELPDGLEALPEVGGDFPQSLNDALDEAVASHPTLKSANADIGAALAQQEAAKHNYYPKFNLEVGGTYGDDQDGLDGRDSDMSAMLRMRYNLFAGGRDQARTKQTAHLVNEAKEVRNKTYRQVVESMRLAWAAYQTAQDQVAFYQQYVDASVRTRDAYVRQFGIGKRTLLDLLDTENELFSAKRKHLNSNYDYLFAKYRILVALGRLTHYLQATREDKPVDDERLQPGYVSVAHDSAVDETIEEMVAGLYRKHHREPMQTDPGEQKKRDIVAFLKAWENAWSDQDIDAYLSRYSEAFVPDNGVSREQWVKQRTRIINRPEWIKIELEQIDLTVQDTHATARFVQDYAASNYDDTVTKVLILALENGIWKIVGETVE
ncbi:MAG: TolC family outer membrane protein [Gammaproteobacteria bacterium]|nr:TolC family outer membrane protein [Gammaproteobacteria bacterium]